MSEPRDYLIRVTYSAYYTIRATDEEEAQIHAEQLSTNDIVDHGMYIVTENVFDDLNRIPDADLTEENTEE